MGKKEKNKTQARVFIGSSLEQIDIAYAAQENLEHDAEVTVWTQDIFELSDVTVEGLLRALDDFDFAIFIFAPDDITRIRKSSSRTVRDNVLFELGLFVGRLGKKRCFLLIPRGEALHLPSDLLGITPGAYEPKRQDGNLVASLGPSCSKIRRALLRVGPIVRRPTARTPSKRVASGLSEEFKGELQRTLASQQTYIEKVMTRFEKRLTSYVETEESVEAADNPARRVLATAMEKLSPVARALLAAIRRRHLTRAQYKRLSTFGSFRQGILELRRVSFLVPVKSAGGSTVYWYPPRVARHIISALRLMTVSPDLERLVEQGLMKAGYLRLGDPD